MNWREVEQLRGEGVDTDAAVVVEMEEQLMLDGLR